MSKSDGVKLGYWLQWQVPVCALIFVVPAVIALRFNKRVKSEPLNSEDLWVSCWKKINPRWLLYYRAFAFLFMAFLLYQVAALFGAFAFYFYTQWTFTLVMVYFALGTIISAHGCWVCSNKPPSETGESTEFLKSDLKESESTAAVTKESESTARPAVTKESGSTAAVTFKAKDSKGAIKLQSHHDEEEIQQRAGF